MAMRRGGHTPPPAGGQQNGRPGPQGDVNEDRERFLFHSVSQGAAAPHLTPAEAGIIDSIQLENFMCHAKLGPVKFGSHVNFVVGHANRKALLTALVVGLGGKSLGSSLREFLKDRELSALISITLRNRGHAAFKSELYGHSITVKLFINVNGTSVYHINDQAGSLVSSEQSELMAILHHFRIQVDNPLSILPQDTGRQLLQISHDGDRYKFFLKVTGLQQRRDEHSEILDRKARIQLEMDQKKEQFEKLKCQGKAIEKHLQRMVALTDKLEDLQHELAWALVSEVEKEFDDMVNEIHIGDQETVLLNQKLEASKAKFHASQGKYRTICENVQKLHEEAAALETRCMEAEEEIKRTDKAFRQLKVFCISFQNELNNLDKMTEHFSKKIEDVNKSLELADLEKQETIPMLKEKLKNFNDLEMSLVQDIKHLHQAIEKGNREHSQIRKEESYVQEILHEEKQQLNHWKECKSEPLKRFGPQIPALLEAVDDAHRRGDFTFKPIGPLGACLRLRDPEFALAIESCLNDLLLAFFCDNHKDEQILQELMKKFYPLGSSQPQIIVSAFECELHDVTDRVANHPEFPTVLTALEIDNPVVVNTLIEMRAIESVLLIKSNSLARRVMQGQAPPKNCSKVFTACGDKVYEKRYYSCEESRPTYLGDIEMEISNLEKEIENKMAQLLAFQQHKSCLEKDARKNREMINSHSQHLKEIKIRVIHITSEIKDVEDEEKRHLVHLSLLEEEVQQIKEEMKEIEEEMHTREAERENLRQLKIYAEWRREVLKVKSDQIAEYIESFMQKQNETALEVMTRHESVMHYEDRLEQHLSSLEVNEEELTIMQMLLEREIAMAKSICSKRKEVTTTVSVLREEVNMLRKLIQSEIHTHGSLEEMRRQYKEVKESCRDLAEKVKNLAEFVKALEVKSTQRYASYLKRRKSLSLRCKLYFHNLVTQWSFGGEMHLDHENETLSITVQPGEGNTTAFSDIQDFSGDRNSFSNFLFILTLWSITESPFRCLDSFDIYMDKSYRKTAMDIILRIAHCQQHHQFILFTPQNMNSFPPTPLIKTLQIPDTDKTMLPFQVVNLEEEEEEEEEEEDEEEEDEEEEEGGGGGENLI